MFVGRLGRGFVLGVAAALVAGLSSVSAPSALAAVPERGPVVAAALAITSAKPKITGTLAVGSTLTAVPGKWSSKTKLTYQWLAAGKAIKKATKATFKLTKAEAGKQISVKVTGKLGSSKASKTSSASAKVMLVGTPKIAGAAAVGSTLIVNRGTWTSGVSFSFQWLRDGLAVPGATGSGYQVAASDAGHKLSVKLTGKRSGYATVSKASAAVSVPAGVAPTTPTIAGMPMVGSALMVNEGTWAQGTTFTYQWLRNGTTIAGATSMSYTLVAADAKQQVSVAVTGKLGSSSETRTSAAVTVTGDGSSTTPTTPTIAGTATVGSALTANPGTWAQGTTFSYQWLRNGTAIAGATSPSYSLVAADGRQLVNVMVTGKSGSEVSSRVSFAVWVANATLKSATPTITGTVAPSQTVTAVVGAWTDDTSFTYQWYADGEEIARGTSSTLRLGYLEAGSKLKVTVTGSKAGYDTVAKTSLASLVPTDGFYQVGIDLPAGTLAAPGSDRCAWIRATDTTEAQSSFIGWRDVARGPALVTVDAGDPWFRTTGCGRWAPASKTGTADTRFGNGDFLVGTQVAPGVYDGKGLGTACQVYWAKGAGGVYTEAIDSFRPTAGQTTARVTIPADAVRVSSMDCGNWLLVPNP